MWIKTPGSPDHMMICLCDYNRVAVVQAPGVGHVWELRAYSPTNDEGVIIKSGDHAHLESLMAALVGTLMHPRFSLTTPTFH